MKTIRRSRSPRYTSPNSAKPVYFTPIGFDNLKKEQETLKESRVDAIDHLKRAREMGDLSENGYYKASRMKVNGIDRRLNELTYLIKYGKIIAQPGNEIIDLGNTVTLQSEGRKVSYLLVGEHEANPREGKISHVSPLGKLLLRKRKGEIVSVHTPAGEVVYTILEIK